MFLFLLICLWQASFSYPNRLSTLPCLPTQLQFHLDEMHANVMYYFQYVLMETSVGKMERRTYSKNAHV